MDKYLMFLSVILISVFVEAALTKTVPPQVEVRAVLISCEPEVSRNVPYDNEGMRFDREELFKHSVLRDCRKKIALTVKIASDPNTGDEYIPIEHVFQGPKTRVRLLNPYVLRLRREPPLQAYKLNKIETVAGILAEELSFRVKRNLEPSDAFTVQNQLSEQRLNTSRKLAQDSKTCGFKEDNISEILTEHSHKLCSSRSKRLDNIIEANTISAGGISQRIAKDSLASGRLYYDKTTRVKALHDDMSEGSLDFNDKRQSYVVTPLDDLKPIKEKLIVLKTKKPKPYEVERTVALPDLDEPDQKGSHSIADDNGQEYDVYEISNKAYLWNTIQVQLFEKMSAPEDKTVWNDLTKGAPARVSSISPEWSAKDMSVRYRSSEWIPRQEFTLPVTSMCLLAPVDSTAFTTARNDNTVDQYIVVPREDVVRLPMDENNDLSENLDEPTKQTEQLPPRVLIRTSRAFISGVNDKLNIVVREGDQFLTLVHRQPYHAQIDIEARADGNQLVNVGSSGRLMTIVADSSRTTRTVLTIQATNTGLAAARFRVVARECQPELPELLNEKVNEAADSFILLPPKQTQSIRLDVPTEIPVDVAHCTVALINADGQTVAVRDVAIRKGDRCFCVWHCECVCLSEDPKLLCREMPEARQFAAGLTLHERTRHVRSLCYPDVISVNLCVMASGVVTTLLFFGFLKACMGLVLPCIGSWGLERILQMPRKLDNYYECYLHGRKVVYDGEGWPVHPDTHQRTVRLISVPMEFILNTIFFVSAPCVIVYDALKQMFYRFKNSDSGSGCWKLHENTKNCYSSHDNIQGSSGSSNSNRRRRRTRLQRWMTPDAETLTSNVLQKGLPVHASMIRDSVRLYLL